jgi:YhcH/YjgK/YiaL family protein
MHLGNLRHQTAPGWYPPILRDLLAFMARTDFRDMPDGQVAVPGYGLDQAYCSVQRYQTRPAEAQEPEAHRLFADVHLIVQGQEAIGWAPRRPDLVVSRAYQPQADIEFFTAAPGESFISLQPDDYLVADLDDVHRPRCCAGQAQPVLKVVGKLRSQLLNA